MADRPRIVILGGGFAGLGAAAKLKHADAELVLIDKHDYHTFQPMLYQVATDLIDPEEVGLPLRAEMRDHKDMTVHETVVTGIDLTNRQIQTQDLAPITYDYLILSLGAQVNFFGTKGAEEHAFPLYTLPDAVRLKDHILQMWEAADKNPALVADGALNIVIVGGGPTGVESAGALIELYRANFVRDYPNLPAKDARIILVESEPALLGMFKKEVQTYAKGTLEKLGVEVQLGERVVEIDSTRATLNSGAVLQAQTLVWAAGLQANALVHALGIPLQHGARIAVGPDLSLDGHPEVFVVGDVASITDTKTKQVLPQLGAVALQAGEQAGENIARRVDGKETEPFHYFDKGTMATIGRGAAVAQLPGGIVMKGRIASLAWGAVHLALLTGGDSRAKTMVDWGWAAITRRRMARVSVDTGE
ncbi:MAG: NAD(P)/FAD-dependent oxidoreductase [Dehalococcoidia bacterium]